MIKEEWRMHSNLFGGTKFALFPIMIFLSSAFIVLTSLITGFNIGQIEVGMQALLFFLGLNVGSIGFISRDRASNLIGEQNLLIFSSRTLPVAKRNIVATFILKDLIYYSVLFVAPMILGLASLNLVGSFTVLQVLLGLVTGVGMFMTGVSVTLVLASLYNLGWGYLFSFMAPVAGLLYFAEASLVSMTPFGFYIQPSFQSFVSGFLPFILLTFFGLAVYKDVGGGKTRNKKNRFGFFNHLLGYDETGIVAKSTLQLLRSSGGLAKIFFSFGIIFGFYAFMMSEIPFLTAGTAAPGMIAAIILSIASLSTYNWITLNDRHKNYLKLPLDHKDVFDAKLSLYLTIAVPVSWLFMGLNAYLYGLDGTVIGALALPSISVYLVGVTAYLAGLQPNEMLFDAKKFTVFMFSLGLVLVPLFMMALLYKYSPSAIATAYLIFSLALGLSGFHVYHEAARKWKRKEEI